MNVSVERVDFDDAVERSMFDDHVESEKSTFIQQSTKWAKAIASIHGDVPVFFYIDDGEDFLGASLYLFEGQFGSILCSNVHAPTIGTFCNDVSSTSSKQKLYDMISNHIISFAEENDCVTVSIMTNPFNQESDILREAFNPDCGIESFIQTISIDDYFDENGNVTFEDYNRRTNLSRNIKKAYENGFTVDTTNDINDLKYWYENIHKDRINEVGGTPLPEELFLRSFEEMRENILFLTAKKDGKIVGGDFCAYTEGGILENMMLSSDKDYFDDGINFFLVDQLLRWCHDNNIAYYDWQSSNPPKGGVFRFKKQWGSTVRPFYHYTRVLDEASFDKLREMDEETLFAAYPDHFIAPYHTLLKGEYSIESKEYVCNITA